MIFECIMQDNNLIDVNLTSEIHKLYDYAMSVIVSRALPDKQTA